ncbi:MAG: hypothetical protein H0X65_15120, partial [Gemmatimonadetes bacterium]|nr:hypothetical protein [Gemmatimonadota bacterium]
MTMQDSPAPQITYRHGLAILRHVREGEAPAWMSYDGRVDALVAPGHRL